MKLRISAKLASVHSEVNVTDREEKAVFTTKTDPLSAPRCTRLYDAEGVELAHYETTRTDEKDRAYSVSIDGGVSFTTKRSFRVSSSTCEAIIKVGQTGWTVLTQRAWSSGLKCIPRTARCSSAPSRSRLCEGMYTISRCLTKTM